MATKQTAPAVLLGLLLCGSLAACFPLPPAPAPSPAITIDDPLDGDSVTTPIPTNGTSNTFEAALTVDVLDAKGNTLCLRNILATAGSGTLGTWRAILAVVPPDVDQPATVRAYEYSAADGSIRNLVQRSITLSAAHPPIFITSPGCGATASPGSNLDVSGRAFVFEAQFTLELRDSTGAAAISTAVMAASGTEESDWNATLTLPASLPLGNYELVAFDNSAKDDSVQDEFAIPITVE